MTTTPGQHRDDPLQPYRDAVREHGPTFEGLLWRDRASQIERFRVLVEVATTGLRVDADELAIADVGCGRADLRAWMGDQRSPPRSYLGIDGVPDLIDACRPRADAEGWQATRFVLDDFASSPGVFDDAAAHGARVFLFSGSLNTFAQDAALDIVRAAARAVRSANAPGAVVANFLSRERSDAPPPPGDPARRFDPRAVLDAALAITPRVMLRHDYLGNHDATIGLFFD